MCDQEQLADLARRHAETGGVSRRQFAGTLAVGGGAAMLAGCVTYGTPPSGNVVTGNVAIPTGSGTMTGWFAHPATGKHPAVIMWPDIAGVRPASKAMGERMAAEGYAVIVPDPYWRDPGHATFADFADFAGNGGFDKVAPWRARFTPQTMRADTLAIVAWLDGQDAVDAAMPIAARGHCMTGAWTIQATAASPRVRVAASMHGGGLVTDKAMSAHKSFVAGANYHIAVAQDDDAKAPEEKTVLARAMNAASAPGDVWVYPAGHGWTVPDSPAYDEREAERAYAKFLAMCGAARAMAS